MIIVTIIYFITTIKTRFKHPSDSLWHKAGGEKKTKFEGKKGTLYSSKEYLMTYTECGKTPCPNFVRWKGGTKQRFTIKELYFGNASLPRYGPSNWVSLRLDIKQKHWSILRKSCISYQCRADSQTYGHRSRDTSDKDEAEIDVCARKCQVAAASTIRAIRSSSESPSHRNTQPSLN